MIPIELAFFFVVFNAMKGVDLSNVKNVQSTPTIWGANKKLKIN